MPASVKMHLTAAAAIMVFSILAFPKGFQAKSSFFDATKQNRKLKTFGTIKNIQTMTHAHCAWHCLALGSQCDGFSFSEEKSCSVNIMRLLLFDFDDPSEVFEFEDGATVFSRTNGETK